jgi:hypothetical protein
MKSKKGIDWIKFNNIKQNSINFSALDGLRKRNIILKRMIKGSILSAIIGYSFQYFYNDFKNTIKDSGKTFMKKLNNLPNKTTAFKDAHRLLCLEYLDNKVWMDIIK